MIALIFLVAILIVLALFFVVREVRLYRREARARHDRPATLEGGGSHLTVRGKR